jgi:nucleoside phosphorylase
MASAQTGLRYRRGRVGVALPHGERREAVERVVRTTGDRPVDLWEISEDPFSLAINAERCDYVVVDLDEPAAVHVADFLQGNATPLLKIAQRGDVPLRLLGTAPLREAAAASELIMYWDDPQTFESKLLQEVARARTGRREFASLEAGQSYFRSLGRTALPVFVSNAGSSSDLARALTDAMSLENIPFFHYQFSNSIGIGRKWADELTELVEASKVFVMLVDEGYWQSEWCRMEYEAATRLAELDRTVIVPFLLGDDTGPVLPRQGKDLRGTPPGEQVRIIVDELDKLFVAAETAPANVVAESGAMVAGTVLVDIAIVTILEEEYEAVLGRLSNVCPVAGTATTPNNHSWVVGEIYSPVYKASFRVVLTLSSVGTNAALAATMNTIPVFEPQYVLVVGVAGGLGDTKLGDVVVANRICAYEYGKLDHGFRPDSSLDSPVDASLSGAARTLQLRRPSWFEESPELRALRPVIHVGKVASGDKVVDDRSDAFFQAVRDSRERKIIAVEMEGAGVASAIQDAREKQRGIGFGMIRGISDVPREGGSRPGRTPGQSEQTETRDAMKKRASAAAATCAAELIRHAWPRPPRKQTPQ